MASLRSAAEVPPSNKEFDPEIVDMASYIHNYKVDSELAVSPLNVLLQLTIAEPS